MTFGITKSAINATNAEIAATEAVRSGSTPVRFISGVNNSPEAK